MLRWLLLLRLRTRQLLRGRGGPRSGLAQREELPLPLLLLLFLLLPEATSTEQLLLLLLLLLAGELRLPLLPSETSRPPSSEAAWAAPGSTSLSTKSLAAAAPPLPRSLRPRDLLAPPLALLSLLLPLS